MSLLACTEPNTLLEACARIPQEKQTPALRALAARLARTDNEATVVTVVSQKQEDE